MTTSTLQTLRPGDPGYDAARLGFQRRRSHRPAVVALAHSADDVTAAILLARRSGRRVAVQATGHGTAAVDDEALLITTGALAEVHIDPDARIARIGAGARWGAVITAAARYGLAPLSGSSPGVGVAGYLVHGGIPLLGRRHGYAAEHVRAVELVTADGEQHRITGGDLFWAVRGGGGSFGVVTAVEIGLIPLTTVYGGALDLPATPQTLRGWRDWAEDAPEQASTSVAVAPFPDPAQPVLSVRIAYEGRPDDGERLVAPLRALAEPIRDELRELAWTESHTIHDDPPGPVASRTTTVALRALPDSVLDAAIPAITAGVPRIVEFRRLGGAFTRRRADAPLRRDAEWSAGTISIMAPGVDDAVVDELDARFRATAAPHTVGRLGALLLGEGADPAAVADAHHPADLARLRRIRDEADPERVLAPAAPLP
ncbi:FAD/FMN-containing dehydrogenase [Pseudonocardia thermophila]|uniref:FAD/FMN-containing dehydrogenase n=1 Tax=Pseudonocardia thermophila TaxID=1848 RepID=A0A1M6W798_PSETH|nr:FAD-binding oxidoreductase [Pseudonocardia thermophila]SHK89662.1 FAD/FMN-containing dehydrogenase [Pseudonocardia thermophila]